MTRIRDAIIVIHSRGEYPSATVIGRELGRSSGINERERLEARRVMKSLGITPQKVGNPFPGKQPSFGSAGIFWSRDR